MTDLSKLSDDELARIAGVQTPGVLEAVKYVESRGNPNAVSPKGAKGRMQVMDDTNADPGFGVVPARDNSPAERERVGRDYLDAMIKQYGLEGGLAAYNGGPGRFQKVGMDVSRMPAESRAYVPAVKKAMGATVNPLANMTDEELAAIAGQQPAAVPEAPEPPAAPQAPFMANVGRGVMDKAQGIKQAWLKLQGDLGIIDPAVAMNYTDDVNKELAAYKQSEPSGVNWGRLAGGMAAEAPLMAMPGGPIAAGAAAGGLAGLTNFAPTGTNQERLTNAAIGAGLGGAVGGIATGARALFGNKANETMRGNVELARQLGINPRPSQFTDNAVARRFEMALDTMPGGAAAFKGNDQKNIQALNNAVLGVFGKSGKEITTETVDDIARQIDNGYATALKGHVLKPDMDLIRDLAKARGEIAQLPDALQSETALKLVMDPRFRANMDASTYNAIRSELGRQAKNAFNANNANTGRVMEQVQAAMDDWAMRKLPSSNAAALAEARANYRSWAVVDKALDPTTGNISPAKLVTAAQKNDPLGFKRGVNPREISTVARAASTIAKTPPDSGTASRMGFGWTGSPVAGALMGGPAGAAVGLGVALPGAYGVGRAYLSPAAQGAARILEEQAGMLAPRVAPMIGGAATQY